MYRKASAVKYVCLQSGRYACRLRKMSECRRRRILFGDGVLHTLVKTTRRSAFQVDSVIRTVDHEYLRLKLFNGPSCTKFPCDKTDLRWFLPLAVLGKEFLRIIGTMKKLLRHSPRS